MDAANKPNYKHPHYTKMEPQLKLMADTYDGLRDCKEEYLQKAESEPAQAYSQRVQRAVFNNKVKPSIDSNAGLLSAFQMENLPASIEESLENLDQMGSNSQAFFRECDTLALRDGLCYVLVDAEKVEGDRTAADAQTNPNRPYLKLIDRRNVLNWRSHYESGRFILDKVTIQFHESVPDGAYGTKEERRYHVFERLPNGVQHTVFSENDKGESIAVTPPTIAPLDAIPLVAYPYTSKPFCTEPPPFVKLAELNIKLLRQESALQEIEYRVNVPTVWRKSVEDPSRRGAVVFGATWVIELMEGDEVGVLEVGGSGIAALQASIAITKEDIEHESMAFLSGSRVERTATEAYLSSTQVQATLNGVAREKASAITRIFDYWCQYTGEENTAEVQADHNLLEMPLDAQEMGQLLSLWQAGGISHATLLEMLKMGKQLPPNFDVEEELKKLAEERAKQSAPRLPSIDDVAGMMPTNGAIAQGSN